MPAIQLPSDQDACGRTFGAEEIEALRAVLDSGTLTCTKGAYVPARSARRASCSASTTSSPARPVRPPCTSRSPASIPSRVTRSSPRRSPTWARSQPDPLPGRHPDVRRRRPRHGERHGRHDRAVPVATAPGPSSSRTCSATRARWTRSWRSPSTHGVPVIEDCAQAFLAAERRPAGRHARRHRLLQPPAGQAHHVRRGRPRRHRRRRRWPRRMRVYVNKAWAYGEPNPDHDFLALNYRITELQGAVARRRSSASSTRTSSHAHRERRPAQRAARPACPASARPVVAPGDVHCYWRYA